MAMKMLLRGQQFGSLCALRSARLFTSLPTPPRFPLILPAAGKRPAFSIRLMQREDLKSVDLLEKATLPAYMTEDATLTRQRFELYPHCSIVACMHKDELLRAMRVTTLPDWASADSKNSVIAGYYFCFPLPERMARTFEKDTTSAESFELLQEALREDSKLLFGCLLNIGPRGLGLGGAMIPVAVALSKQLGFTRFSGVTATKTLDLWRKFGFSVVNEVKQGYFPPGSETPDSVFYFVIRDL